MVNPQILACPVQAIDMSVCMKQDLLSMKTCCRAINQVVAVGHHCFCSLLGNMNSLFDGQILFAFSTCFVPLPPLAKCQVTVPVEVLPPKTREDPLSTSKPNVVLPPVSAPTGGVHGDEKPSLQVPREKNPTSLPVTQVPPRAFVIANSTKKSKGAKIKSISLYKTIIVIVILHWILEGI
ncbi:hypothetical protein ACHQM5_027479 [Ranunculus cassubicifolius]